VVCATLFVIAAVHGASGLPVCLFVKTQWFISSL